MTSAELCRQNGWGPGTVLESACGRVRITAVGHDKVLALYACAYGGVEEMVFSLTAHDWRVATSEPLL